MAKKWNVKVTANPNFCGIDAGGVQFAHGEAEIEDKRLVQWFKKHKGYEVTEVKAEKKAEEPKKAEKKPEGGETAQPKEGE